MSLSLQQVKIVINQQLLFAALNLNIQRGEFWGVCGINGAGKTTLLKTLCGLHIPDAGQVLLDGIPLAQIPPKSRARQIALMQQDYDYAFSGTVLQAVLMSRFPYLPDWQFESREDYEIAHENLQLCQLQGYEQRPLHTLSGGERQRLHLAMLLTQQSRYLLLDEPGNHLDLAMQKKMLYILQQYRQQHQAAIILCSHDINLISHYCHKVIMIMQHQTQRQCLIGNTEDILTTENLSAMLGQKMLQTTINHKRYFFPE